MWNKNNLDRKRLTHNNCAQTDHYIIILNMKYVLYYCFNISTRVKNSNVKCNIHKQSILAFICV